ncbi:MAG: 2-dehydropantoate 2-reductase [Candidatus Binatota bacterium]|jgi:2-dehydropantoate 2-reductase|nr:2-dehydropantoate 2-reductase [Candidatus Binatota bacterium]
MRILVVGAGAVGAVFGAKLAQAGHRVTFQARGANLDALRERGLRVESFEGDLCLFPVDAIRSPEGAGPFELVLVCVKAHDTAAALEGLAGELAPDAIVLSLQNGVGAEERIAQLLGVGPLLHGLAYVSAELVDPAIVRHTNEGTIVVGEADGRRSPRLERLLTVLEGAGIRVRVPDDIARAKWQKLAWNASFNVICAITRKTASEVLASAGGRALVEDVMREVERVAASAGVVFEDDYVARVIALTERNLGNVRPSTLQDRDRGKPLENPALTGTVVRLGEHAGVATPVSATLDRIATSLTA